ncbi:MAG: hypothetical protein IJH83_00710 [Coriobacteriales bacterium]|nr:hypothetical protein [Coriobacteriales bacterium]
MPKFDLSKIEVINALDAALNEYRKTHTEEEVQAALKARGTLMRIGLGVMITGVAIMIVCIIFAIVGEAHKGLLVFLGFLALVLAAGFVAVFSSLSEQGRIASTRAWCDVQKLIK